MVFPYRLKYFRTVIVRVFSFHVEWQGVGATGVVCRFCGYKGVNHHVVKGVRVRIYVWRDSHLFQAARHVNYVYLHVNVVSGVRGYVSMCKGRARFFYVIICARGSRNVAILYEVLKTFPSNVGAGRRVNLMSYRL